MRSGQDLSEVAGISVTRRPQNRPMQPAQRIKIRNLAFSALLVTAVFWASQPGGIGQPIADRGAGADPLTDSRPAATSSGPVEIHVVRPGDTIWSIARRVQPEGDLRPLVDRITSRRDSSPLQVGEEIVVPIQG